MVQIQAFRGLRYDLSRVGDLSDVVAPPYDVINPQLQDKLYSRHPANVVRLILNRREPNDADESPYQRAAKFFRDWRREGILLEDKTPALYVYHQEFTHEGERFNRRGFMARVRLEPFGSGTIYPHEQTHAKVKEDRLRLTKACRANLSQIFGAFPDPQNAVQQLLESAISDRTPLTATDHLGVIHRVWHVTDEPSITRAAGLMASQPIFVADGHHRYETACAYRDFLAAQRNLVATDPANYVLMMCVGMRDSGLIVLPTHRMFRGVPPMTSQDLGLILGDAFDLVPAGRSIEDAAAVWKVIANAIEPSTSLGLYTAKDQVWSIARLTPSGSELMSKIAPGQSEDWRALGVSVLHDLVVHHLLKLKILPAPLYVHSVDEVISHLHQGDTADRDATGQIGTQEPFQMAALVHPPSVDDIRRVSLNGERMPAKSTFFYPKLLCGLVFNPLE